MLDRDQKFYKVTYSRLLAGGTREVFCPVMSEKDLKSILLDESRFKYIVISAEQITEAKYMRHYTDNEEEN